MHHANLFAIRRISLSQPLECKEKKRILLICLLALFSILFWIAYNQGGSSLTLFALHDTKRTFGTITIPPAWFLSIESLYLIILVLPLTAIYRWLNRHNLNPSPPLKIAYSLLAMAICFFIMAAGSSTIEPNTIAQVSPWYLLTAYGFMALGEMLIWPIGLALITHLSPPRCTASLVGLWYFCIGVAFYLGGEIAPFMSSVTSLDQFFWIFVWATLIPALLLIGSSRWLNRMRGLRVSGK
jgi:POT family proton-dependent oligopeptide transporter